MKVFVTPKFKKAYDKLPQHIQKKTKKAINFIKKDISHPSLGVKRMTGTEKTWEARVDRSYRFTFEKTDEGIILETIGPHDEGLGKK